MSIKPHISHTDDRLKWVERTARLMDSKFRIPGTDIRFGLDPIFSIIPVAGDTLTAIVSIVLIRTMNKHGASKKLVIKMGLNVLVDFLIGSIPLIGTLFDIAYKANNRNVELLREHYQEGKHQGSGKGILLLLGFLIIGGIVGIIYLGVLLVKYLMEHIDVNF